MNRNYVFTIASIDPAHAHIRIPSYSQNMQNAAVDFDPRTQMYQYSGLASVTEYGGLSSRATPTYAPRLLLILM